MSAHPLQLEGSGSALQDNVLVARDSRPGAFVEWAWQYWERSPFCSVWRMGDEGEGDRGD